MKLKFLGIPLILLMTGCSSYNVSLNSFGGDDSICEVEPKWAVKPPVEKNTIYGVGIAPRNFNGKQAQRQSAISKAINEIASQMNTTVNSQVATQASVHNGHGSSSMNSVSFQTVNGEKVGATIIKSCKNPNTGYLYILMKAKR